jgi:malate synthase
MVSAVSNRVNYTDVDGAAAVLTPEFLEYLVALHDEFVVRVHDLRAKRAGVLRKAIEQGILPGHLATSDINTTNWRVPPVPDDLMRPGIEITGPASITSMFINALNPGPEGERAVGDLDDDEDAAGHRLIDTVTAARNRLAAVERTLEYRDEARGRHYKIQDGELPFFMHRERGLHLDEPELTIDGKPASAAILGTALTIFHAGRAQMARGHGLYFYLAKMESADEAGFWKDFFDFSKQYLGLGDDDVIRAVPLVESLPAAYQMEEMLYALGPYAAGLNAARWDFKASIFEFIMADPNQVWPDRFGVDIKTTDFLANIFRRLVAICLKHGAVPIGGMATALPSRDEAVNKAAAASITADKEWEANQGFVRAWVAHIFHMKTAAEPFKKLQGSGREPTPRMADPDNYPIEIKAPEGPITVEGTRRNIRMLIEYVEGWLNGRGAKGIDSLAGKPGLHGPLMEDLATGRMSAAQTAQRITHSAKDTTTDEVHDFALVKQIVLNEVKDILRLLKEEVAQGNEQHEKLYTEAAERYSKAGKIALRWVRNYTEFDFRSLGSYTREDLEAIAVAKDAF